MHLGLQQDPTAVRGKEELLIASQRKRGYVSSQPLSERTGGGVGHAAGHLTGQGVSQTAKADGLVPEHKATAMKIVTCVLPQP